MSSVRFPDVDMSVLMGKDRPGYTPHALCGRGVIVINAALAKMTGNKPESKQYRSFSGYPGGYKERPYKRLIIEKPEFIIKHAVKGMLPNSRLGKRMITHLLVYKGAEHPHMAQKPEAVTLLRQKKGSR